MREPYGTLSIVNVPFSAVATVPSRPSMLTRTSRSGRPCSFTTRPRMAAPAEDSPVRARMRSTRRIGRSSDGRLITPDCASAESASTDGSVNSSTPQAA